MSTKPGVGRLRFLLPLITSASSHVTKYVAKYFGNKENAMAD